MELNNKPKKLNYFLILSFSIFQFAFITSIIIICIVYQYSNIFIHLTNWSYLLSSFYLYSISICETSLYFFSSRKLENYKYFIRNKFSIIAFPFCFLITIGFWGILIFGIIIKTDTFLKSGTEITAFGVFINFNIHLAISIMMLVELCLNEREEIKLNWYICISNTIFLLIYTIVICIAKYAFDKNAYLFMENLNAGGMILVGILIYGLLIGCIFIYISLSNKINRKKKKNIENIGEEDNTFGNEGLNGDNNKLSPD